MILNGILWILATGAPWRDLPEHYGPWSTVANRFYTWQRRGLWDQILVTLQEAAQAQGTLDWSLHFLDGTVIRAHQHAAGARKGGGDEALGREASAVSARSFTSVQRVGASRWYSDLLLVNGMSRRCLSR